MKRSRSIFLPGFMPGSLAALAETLHEAHRRAAEIEFLAQLVLQETLETEMQRGLLVGEEQKCGRRGFCLRDVVNAHGARLGRAAALQVDVFFQPAIQIWSRDAAPARKRDLINQGEDFLRSLAGFRGDKDDGRI